MARPREFDTKQVLDEIIELFWSRGFAKTSFAQLEKATGLRKASLCGAFGSKEKLFLHALSHYHVAHCKALSCICERQSAREALRTWLHAASGRSAGRSGPRGCLTVNTLVEFAPHNRACAKVVALQMHALEKMLENLLRRGIRAAEFRRSLNPSCAARYLICVVSGLQALSRTPQTCASTRSRNEFVELVIRALS